jgi:hypothetical protein
LVRDGDEIGHHTATFERSGDQLWAGMEVPITDGSIVHYERL